MTNYERIKAMSLEEMAAFVEAAGRNTCHKICVYRQGSENCKNLTCQTGIKHWLESESEQIMRLIDADVLKPKILEYVKALARIKYCYNCGAKMDGKVGDDKQ